MAETRLRRYLDRHAEPIVTEFEAQLRPHIHQTYQFVLVIPLYAEPRNCLEQVLPSDLQNTVVIGVVNAASDRPSPSIHTTQTLLSHLRGGQAPLAWVPYTADTALLVVDCCSPGRQLPPKQGVGLARKIGADLAIACIETQLVASPWIYCTDADATLPEGYFDGEALASDVAVALYPFSHQPAHAAILHYEISLRYYVTQLAIAGSPYAFQTIGSLLKISASHYAAVRGFPKRRAAEDFYLLNKLAKTGKVMQLQAPQIVLSSRKSTRVPFGTGATMVRLAADPRLQFYDPRIFKCLKAWLVLIDPLWQARKEITQSGLAGWWQRRVQEEELVLAILLQLGLEQTLTQAYRQCQDDRHFKFFLAVWFDAFRTLKFVHGLRDGLPLASGHRAFPSHPLAQLAKTMDWSQDLGHGSGTDLSLPTLQSINHSLMAQELRLPTEVGPTVVLADPKRHCQGHSAPHTAANLY